MNDPVARLGGFSIFYVFWIEHGLIPKMCRRQYIHDPMQGQKCCMKFNGSRQGFQSHSRKTHKSISIQIILVDHSQKVVVYIGVALIFGTFSSFW